MVTDTKCAEEAVFRFLVQRAGHLQSAGVWFVDGVLLEGKIVPGSIAQLEGTNVTVTIKSIALVNAPGAPSNQFTLAIAKPEVAMDSLVGGVLTRSS